MKYFILITVILLSCVELFSLNESYKYHTIKEGETLWRISKNYDVSLEKICKVNKINDVTKVKKGAVIKIPINNNNQQINNNIKKTNNSTNKNKNYINLKIPLNGSIKPFVTPNIKGIIIFTMGKNNGQKVVSADSGTVSYVDVISGYGLSIIVKHSNNLISIYSGFDSVSVKKGDSIKRGDAIGNAGRLSQYNKDGILFSVQKNNAYLKFDMNKNCFYF